MVRGSGFGVQGTGFRVPVLEGSMFFRKLRCSFCRRNNDQVEKLVAGARGYI